MELDESTEHYNEVELEAEIEPVIMRLKTKRRNAIQINEEQL